MDAMKTVTKEAARNFLVSYHNLNETQGFIGSEGVLKCFERTRSIQYDPLNVVGRNADLVLQGKVKGYKPPILHELLYEKKELVDGFDKEMCIYLSEEFQWFSRIRALAGERVKMNLTNRRQLEALNILDEVRSHIREHGKTGTKDISIGKTEKGGWGHSKLSSAALDYLYTIGELCVAEKRGTQKYFDFTENVLPRKVLQRDSILNDRDFIDWYVKRRIQSVGFLWNRRGGAWQGHYLSDPEIRSESLNRLCEKGQLSMFSIEEIEFPFYMAPEDEVFFDTVASEKHVKFLAPLDNVLWDREMVANIFNFEYSWEVYIPVEKRKYGYYVLPVLYGNDIIARFEPVKTNKGDPLTIKNWWWESGVKVTEALLGKMDRAIQKFAEYLSVPYQDTYREVLTKRRG